MLLDGLVLTICFSSLFSCSSALVVPAGMLLATSPPSRFCSFADSAAMLEARSLSIIFRCCTERERLSQRCDHDETRPRSASLAASEA